MVHKYARAGQRDRTGRCGRSQRDHLASECGFPMCWVQECAQGAEEWRGGKEQLKVTAGCEVGGGLGKGVGPSYPPWSRMSFFLATNPIGVEIHHAPPPVQTTACIQIGAKLKISSRGTQPPATQYTSPP